MYSEEMERNSVCTKHNRKILVNNNYYQSKIRNMHRESNHGLPTWDQKDEIQEDTGNKAENNKHSNICCENIICK